jgi:hypothetical protein
VICIVGGRDGAVETDRRPGLPPRVTSAAFIKHVKGSGAASPPNTTEVSVKNDRTNIEISWDLLEPIAESGSEWHSPPGGLSSPGTCCTSFVGATAPAHQCRRRVSLKPRVSDTMINWTRERALQPFLCVVFN